jgi:hypothetical protein
LREVSSSGFITSGPFASEWITMSTLPNCAFTFAAHSDTV